uniref:Integrase catalytic domain-containing protein n=1 Tax=Sipha flava TaxID=143950 RepID=A0A2S2PW18_9HEMI
MMEDLPFTRVTQARSFLRVAIDYAGSLSMKENRLRKTRVYKVYVVVFVCFEVRAIYLELVWDVSTNAFIAALNQFVTRRWLPSVIFTDCGTKFVGVFNKLPDLVNDPSCHNQITGSTYCTWHFNPSAALHLGGLWEAPVKYIKSLMT